MLAKTRYAAGLTAVCLLMATPAAAGASPQATGAKASKPKTSNAKVQRELKKVRKQLTTLKRQVAKLSAAKPKASPQGAPGPQGATGAQGPQGAKGADGMAGGPAGGDLSGTFPNPQVTASAIGGAELAGNAITHDTSIINTSLGNFTEKIGAGAIGRSEIADGEVRSTELGVIETHSVSEWIAPGDFGVARADCDPGQQMLSGGNDLNEGVVSGLSVMASHAYDADTWRVLVENNSTTTDAHLRTFVYCLGG